MEAFASLPHDLTADLDLGILDGIRNSIHVFRDRRPELYRY